MPITARYFEIIKILYRADQSIMDAIENPVPSMTATEKTKIVTIPIL